MKAISLWQPWASAVADGSKRNETRHWPTNYRGDLVICSAKRSLDTIGLAVAREHNIPLTAMKFGYALCIVEVFDCLQTDVIAYFRKPIAKAELELGDYTPGRFVWLTRNLRKLRTPVPVIGRQGFWNLPDDVVERITANLPKES